MAKKLEGTMYLCMGTNGLKTPMEKMRVKLVQPKGKPEHLKEQGGKRKIAPDMNLFFKAEYKGRTEILGYVDRETLLPLSPKEVMTGPEFSRTEVKNAISYNLDAERELRARYKSQGIDSQSKFLLAALIIFIIGLTVVTVLYGQALGHPDLQVYYTAGNIPKSNSSGIFATVGNTIKGVTSIP